LGTENGRWLVLNEHMRCKIKLSSSGGNSCHNTSRYKNLSPIAQYNFRSETVKLDFKTMRALSPNLRLTFARLSTDTKSNLDTHPLATSWVWYWQDQMGVWIEYGQVSLFVINLRKRKSPQEA